MIKLKASPPPIPKTGRNRRQFYRQSTGPQLSLSLSLKYKKRWFSLLINNASVGGIGAILPDRECPFSTGIKVTLRITIQDTEEHFEMSAMTRHVVAHPEGTYIGLQFNDPTELFKNLRGLNAPILGLFNRRGGRRFIPSEAHHADISPSTEPLKLSEGVLHDLTLIGVGIRLKKPPMSVELDTLVRVYLELPCSHSRIELIGRVRHITPVRREVHCGVLFDPKKTPTFIAIESLLASYILQHDKSSKKLFEI